MIFESTKEYIDKRPFYSEMKRCPLKHHGYKVTNKNIDLVIEEIKYELSVYPENADILLDHILNLQAQKQ